MKKRPEPVHRPCYSGLQVQGTANSPVAQKLDNICHSVRNAYRHFSITKTFFPVNLRKTGSEASAILILPALISYSSCEAL